MKTLLYDEQSEAGEVLVRWECHCTAPRWACPDCGGEGIVDRWLPAADLPLMDPPYAIISSDPIQKAA